MGEGECDLRILKTGKTKYNALYMKPSDFLFFFYPDFCSEKMLLGIFFLQTAVGCNAVLSHY